MTAPSAVPVWATATNYAGGSLPGTPTKVTPTYQATDGYRPGSADPPNPQELNFTLNLLCQWAAYLASGESPELTTPAIGTSQNNYTTTGLSTALIVRLNITANVSFTGFDASGTRSLQLFINPTAFTAKMEHEDSGSTAVNRNFNSTGADYDLGPNQAALKVYDHTTQRHRFFPLGAITGGGGGPVTWADIVTAAAAATTAIDFNNQGLEGVAYVKPDPGQEFTVYKGTSQRFFTSGLDTEIRPDASGFVFIRDEIGTIRLAVSDTGVSLSGNRLQGGLAAVLSDDFVVLSQLLSESVWRGVAATCTAACSFNGQGINVGYVAVGAATSGKFRMSAGDVITSRGAPATGLSGTDLNLMTLDASNSLEIGASNIPVADLNSQTLSRMRVGGVPKVASSAVLTTIDNPLEITSILTMTPRTSASVPTPATGKYALFIDSGSTPANKLRKKDDTGAVSDVP